MEATPEHPHHWMLILYQKHLAIGGFIDDALLLEGNLSYDELPVRVCPECISSKEGLTTLPLSTGARTVLVCGRPPQEAAQALELASVIHSRRLPTTSRKNRVDLPVDEHVLTAILKTLYADAPRAVAEAVRAMRKV